MLPGELYVLKRDCYIGGPASSSTCYLWSGGALTEHKIGDVALYLGDITTEDYGERDGISTLICPVFLFSDEIFAVADLSVFDRLPTE